MRLFTPILAKPHLSPLIRRGMQQRRLITPIPVYLWLRPSDYQHLRPIEKEVQLQHMPLNNMLSDHQIPFTLSSLPTGCKTRPLSSPTSSIKPAHLPLYLAHSDLPVSLRSARQSIPRYQNLVHLRQLFAINPTAGNSDRHQGSS